MNELVWIFISALLINNFVLAYFLGLCPFLGVSGRLETAFRLGLATIFVMLITALCAWFLNTYILIHAPYLRLISFIVVIASTVQFIEMVIKKTSPALFKALGIFLPLITTNCVILGRADGFASRNRIAPAARAAAPCRCPCRTSRLPAALPCGH